MLGRLGRTEAAIEAVKAWNGQQDRPAEQLATMGEVLARFGEAAEADRLFTQALAGADLKATRRYDLLVRRAGIHSGMPRWQALLKAASLRLADSAARRECFGTLLSELDRPSHAESAGTLANEAKDPQMKLDLRFRQAELTTAPLAASEIVRGISQSGRMPDGRLGWACQSWNRAGQPNFVIEAAEARLRAGRSLPSQVLGELEAAYRSAGRLVDSKRAATSDLEIVPAASAPPSSEPRTASKRFLLSTSQMVAGFARIRMLPNPMWIGPNSWESGYQLIPMPFG